jgi:hypothetical protein
MFAAVDQGLIPFVDKVFPAGEYDTVLASLLDTLGTTRVNNSNLDEVFFVNLFQRNPRRMLPLEIFAHILQGFKPIFPTDSFSGDASIRVPSLLEVTSLITYIADSC